MTDEPPLLAWLHREGHPPVPVTGNCALGRAVGNDLVLVDDRVSRRHATIHAQGDEFLLVDLGSRNGTYLNGRRVSQPTRLSNGDSVQIGPFQMTFELLKTSERSRSGTTTADQTHLDLRSGACWLLVADIIGSTALTRERPSEELAVMVGGWFASCKDLIEDNGGTINKYLGDGFLAYWMANDFALPHVAQTLRDLRRIQEKQHPPFRLVIHHGQVVIGGIPSSGEESLSGPEVNFVFRQEKLAGQLRCERLASASAAALIAPLTPVEPAGEHAVASFEGLHKFYRF
jgi:adenylate cyclase